eukprot:gene29184-35222_t
MSQKIAFLSIFAYSIVYSASEISEVSQQLTYFPSDATLELITEDILHDGKNIIFFPVQFRATPLNTRRNNLYGISSPSLPVIRHCLGCKDTNPLNPYALCPVPYLPLEDGSLVEAGERCPAGEDIYHDVRSPITGAKYQMLEDAETLEDLTLPPQLPPISHDTTLVKETTEEKIRSGAQQEGHYMELVVQDEDNLLVEVEDMQESAVGYDEHTEREVIVVDQREDDLPVDDAHELGEKLGETLGTNIASEQLPEVADEENTEDYKKMDEPPGKDDDSDNQPYEVDEQATPETRQMPSTPVQNTPYSPPTATPVLFWVLLAGLFMTVLMWGLSRLLPALFLPMLYTVVEKAYLRAEHAKVVRWARWALFLTLRVRGEGGETLSLRHYIARSLLSLPFPPFATIQTYLSYIQNAYEQGVGAMKMGVLLKGCMMGGVYEDLGLVNSLQGKYEQALTMFNLSLQLYVEEYEMKEGLRQEDDFVGSGTGNKGVYSESKLYSRLNSSLYSPSQNVLANGDGEGIEHISNGYPSSFPTSYPYPPVSPMSTSVSPLSPASSAFGIRTEEPEEEEGKDRVRRSLDAAFWKETRKRNEDSSGGDLFRTLEELESLVNAADSPPQTPPHAHNAHAHAPQKLYMSGDVARLCMRIGGVLVRLGRGGEGVGYIQRALDICMLMGGEGGEVKALREMMKAARELEEKERREEGHGLEEISLDLASVGKKVKVPSPISVAQLDLLEKVFR